MNTLLLTVAITSLAAVAVFAVIVWRLLALDRRRAQARIAALGSAIDTLDAAIDAAEGRRPVDHHDATRADLFDPSARPALGGRPLIKAAAVVAMATAIIVFVAMSGERPGAGATPATSAAAGTPALELLSMRYSRVGETLTVAGLVRNAGDATAARLTAVVFAFDKNGGFLASGHAPLEFERLATGDESPFEVTIPHLPDIGRYRVSFRTDAGTVPHVDRRGDALRASFPAR